MTFYVENETKIRLAEDEKELLSMLTEKVLASEGVEREVSVNLLITDEEGIREYNRSYRGMDKATDVLSFPAVDFDSPSDFSRVDEEPASYLDPETDEVVLGDIIVSAPRAIAQAEEYGHGIYREFAFLLTHSLLHLLGYDHETEEEAEEMFAKQEQILQSCNITR